MDALQKITDAPLADCPKCQTPNLKRGVGGGIGLAFKGSGFYITDYGKADTSCKQQDACPCAQSGD